MNSQYLGYSNNTLDNEESIAENKNSPVVNSDVFADKVPVDTNLIHEVPMGGTIAAVGQLYGPVPDVAPIFETPDQEIPMGGTVAAVGPMNETLVHEDTPVETIPRYAAPTGETIAAESLLVNQSSPTNQEPIVEPVVTRETPISTNAGQSTALLSHEESEHFRTRWNEIQGKFVDEPRLAVQEADGLVSEVIEHITQMFTKEHSSLESQWKQGNEVSTEEFRKALQHYRSFFNRLVV